VRGVVACGRDGDDARHEQEDDDHDRGHDEPEAHGGVGEGALEAPDADGDLEHLPHDGGASDPAAPAEGADDDGSEPDGRDEGQQEDRGGRGVGVGACGQDLDEQVGGRDGEQRGLGREQGDEQPVQGRTGPPGRPTCPLGSGVSGRFGHARSSLGILDLAVPVCDHIRGRSDAYVVVRASQ
jgi:hypothetical protein